jgi:lipopolysaccharide/colanic/teichoic acid biosynthesis glycosyltransferase
MGYTSWTGSGVRAIMLQMHSNETDTVLSASSFALVVETSTPIPVDPDRTRRLPYGPQHTFRYRYINRGLDIFLPLLLLILAGIALAIRIGSPGPIFFSHRRVRYHGAAFSMWKFRTMCVNSTEVLENYLAGHPEARAEWRRTHKLKHDPRVTPVGAFLRRTSLDELPQLWNVFTGSMSLVGPRPIVAAEVEKYGPYFADYGLVKPGLTGLWQVSGRSACTYAERVQLDRRYAHNWSLWGDFKILARTFRSVVNQDGAY